MPAWKLDRPFALLDIEATGTVPRADRMVELAILVLFPNGTRTSHVFRFNPGMPIPLEAQRIHGISDADVADKPRFKDLAPELLKLLDGCDLGGYNILRYDLPLLVEEFRRAGIVFDETRRRVVDVQRIYHKREPRDLAAALSFYCGEMHLGAHGAAADVSATLRVLEGQFQRYPDLPRDIESLDKYCNPRRPDWVDRTGKLKWVNGEIVLNFGKRKGELLKNIVRNDPNFTQWILRSDFPRDVIDVVEQGTRGVWPPAPEAPPESTPTQDPEDGR